MHSSLTDRYIVYDVVTNTHKAKEQKRHQTRLMGTCLRFFDSPIVIIQMVWRRLNPIPKCKCESLDNWTSQSDHPLLDSDNRRIGEREM